MFTHKFFGAGNSCELLEQHAILGFKNILVCQMIYAMVYDFPFIAVIRTLADLCKNGLAALNFASKGYHAYEKRPRIAIFW
jgi:hypothetical protein